MIRLPHDLWKTFFGDQTISKDAFKVLTLKIFAAILIIGIQVPIARMLGPVEYGRFSFILSWCVLLAVFGKCGFETTYIRYIPIYRERNDTAAIRKLIIFSALLCGTLSLFLSLTAFFTIINVGLVATILSLGIVLSLVATPLLDAYLKSHDIVLKSHVIQELIRPIALFIFFLVFYFYWQTDGHLHALAAYMAALFLTVLLLLFVCSKTYRTPAEKKEITSKNHTRKEWLYHAFPILMIGGMAIIVTRIDVIMIGFYKTDTDVAIYSIAQRIAEFVSFALLAANAVLSPYLARSYETGAIDDIQQKIDRTMRPLAIATIAISLFFVLSGSWILGVFGPVYKTAILALFILIIGQAFNALSGPANLVLSVTGHQRTALLISIVAVTVNIIGNMMLIPLYGINGAAFVSALSFILWNFLMIITVKKKTKLKTYARLRQS